MKTLSVTKKTIRPFIVSCKMLAHSIFSMIYEIKNLYFYEIVGRFINHWECGMFRRMRWFLNEWKRLFYSIDRTILIESDLKEIAWSNYCSIIWTSFFYRKFVDNKVIWRNNTSWRFSNFRRQFFVVIAFFWGRQMSNSFLKQVQTWNVKIGQLHCSGRTPLKSENSK